MNGKIDSKAVAELGAPEHKRVVRDGELDLVFDGWLLGTGRQGTGGWHPCDWTRGIEVRIWLTAGGSIVTGLHRWSRWPGESEHHLAAVHDTPEAALEWMRVNGDLDPSAKDAWIRAAGAWSGLRAADVERVA